MIEWMQTHRKWLVITIWIATVAFIGAGFVGWGQFQFGRKTSTVAKIKNTEVSIEDVQNIYNELFQQKNQQMGGTLDDATAEKMGLKKQALALAIQQGLLRQYAKDLGFHITDEEVAREILKYFKNKKNYMRYLRQTGQRAKDFETNLRKKMLIQKLLSALHIVPSQTLLKTFGSALYNSDELEIATINKSSINIKITDQELKKYWEKNKNRYQSPVMYKIALVKTPIKGITTVKELKQFYNENKTDYRNANGEILSFDKAKDQVKRDYLAKLTLKSAIMAYKGLKDGAQNYKLISIPLNNNIIPLKKMKDLIQIGHLKPFIDGNNYISAKLIEEIKPKPLTFAKAEPFVKKDLIHIKTIEALNNTAKNSLKNFKGKNIGFVTKYDVNKLNMLTPLEATQFLFTEFSLEQQKGYILVPLQNPQKAVLYRVLEQKLLDKSKYMKNLERIKTMASTTVNAALLNDLLKDLTAKYHIVTYVK